MTGPGWYPDPGGTAQQRYFDGQRWTAHGVIMQPRKRPHWLVWVAIGCLAVVVATLGGVMAYNGGKPVRTAHSDDPGIEAFYREIEAEGFGNMRVNDAKDRARKACNGNGLVLWGTADYSMADSFNFAAAAMQACSALRY